MPSTPPPDYQSCPILEEPPAVELPDVLDVVLELLDLVERIAARLGVPL